MKIKIWTCVITIVIAAVILKGYVSDYRKEKETVSAKVSERETERAGRTQEAKAIIRVLIRNDQFEDVFHETLEISGTGDFYREENGKRDVFAAGTVIRLEADGFAGTENAAERDPETENRCIFSPCEPDDQLILPGLKRRQENPRYTGKLEITGTDRGYVVINELPLEDYLPAVLSSEMASFFPEEALKAQAICARTYAMKRLLENTDIGYGANLDDSTANQVYNNTQSDDVTRQAVRDTNGLILTEGGQPADVYYYSTSCGVTKEDDFSSEEEIKSFLGTVRESDPEHEEAWYRWNAEVSSDDICRNLSQMRAGVDYGQPEEITELEIVRRAKSGQVLSLKLLGKEDGREWSAQLDGEYRIRQVLRTAEGNLTLQDESACDTLTLLPSAWFTAEPSGQGKVFFLLGGGYGHGNGMSQNGAKWLALQGRTCQEILEAYYPGTHIKDEKD